MGGTCRVLLLVLYALNVPLNSCGLAISYVVLIYKEVE